MKKLISIIIVLSMMISCVSCGKNPNASGTEAGQPATGQTQQGEQNQQEIKPIDTLSIDGIVR